MISLKKMQRRPDFQSTVFELLYNVPKCVDEIHGTAVFSKVDPFRWLYVVSLRVYETSSEVAIVLELAAGGELQRVLDEEERLPERCARKALRHALEGLQHMHARRIAHLDLKPQNLLLAAGKEDLLICDFGISRAILPGARVREILGTRDYVAPEILSYEPLSLAADIWSVGVLAYVLLSGYSPFAGDTKQETYLNIAQCQLSFPRDCFRGVSPLAKKFIRETLVVDPKGRLTVEECLAHPWLKDDVDLPCAIVGLGFDSAAEPADDSDSEEPAELRNGHATHNGHAAHNGRSTTAARDHKADASDGRPSSPVNGTTDSRGPTSAPAPAHDENGCGEEREKPLKHPHGRETSPPFPDAPSTPKVSRKSHPHPPSVLALCKKFQPDYEKPAKLAHAHHTSHSAHAPAADACGCGYECGGHTCLRPRAPLPPDRAVIC
ncbi:Death-associated protein kinase related [Eumeta japonica]|uniref:Death-associated protein kinase related n=1 Tax=Eumeta variegata TaxID=151549 RepID=A0A4C1X1N7_EUMVA|nr:Death-associated protein kinase related [Eumeta japonica]